MFSKSSPILGFKGHWESQSGGTGQSEIQWREQERNQLMKFIHTSHLWWHDWFSLRVLKCRIVFLPPPISSSIPASICPPTRQHQRLMDKASVCLRHWRRGWRVEEQLRRMKGEIWECNFPSVNLPSREQVDHQSGGVDSEGRHLTGARWVTASCHYINTAMRDIKKGFFFCPVQLVIWILSFLISRDTVLLQRMNKLTG